MRRALALSALLLLAPVGCNPQAPRAQATPSPRPRAAAGLPLRIVGRGNPTRPVTVYEKKGNRLQVELVADSFESIGAQGTQRADFRDARVTFHDRNGATLYATAPQAIVDQAQKTVTLIGGVDAHTGTGMSLHCRRLVYDRRDEMLHGDGDVIVVDPGGFRGTGSRFQSDISLTHYRMQ